MLHTAAGSPAATAAFWRPAGACLYHAAGVLLHASRSQAAGAAAQPAAAAPPEVEEAVQAVRDVMGAPHGSAAQPPPTQQQQEFAPLRFDDPKEAFKAKSTLDLLRSLLVFQACRIQPLVTHADSVLAWSKRLFGSTLTNWGIKQTFYRQFVAGESLGDLAATLSALGQQGVHGIPYFAESEDAHSIQPTLRRMKACGVRAILDYAAEDDVAQEEGPKSRHPPQDSVVARTYAYEDERVCDSRMSVFLKSIEAAQSAEGQGFAAIKVTALGLPTLLERASNSLLAIRDLFRRFDEDGNGHLTQEEFAQVYSQLFVDDAPERIEQVFRHLDVGRGGKVDYVDWISRISPLDTADIASRCRSRGPFAEAALDDQETRLLRNMMDRVDRLAQAAADADVRLLIDAEHSYFQPAIDNTVTELQRRYNRSHPLIYNTIQAYLKDSHSRLGLELERARREGYKYGVKLVRGAYMVLERQRAKDMGYTSPIHDTIQDTHGNYDRCVADMLQCVREEGAEVMVASHNQASIEKTVEAMMQLGLPPSSGVYFGQLLGMADHLTYTLGAHGYGAYKYVPFGAVDEVMPYLIRRAQENSSVLAGVQGEMGMMRRELKRRLLGSS